MYCNHCKKEVNAAGNICPYCANQFTEEQIHSDMSAKANAQNAMTTTKSKTLAFILNYVFCGIGGVAYLGFKQLARERVKDWFRAFLYCLTVVGIIFAVPKMLKLFSAPFIDMKNIFSSKDVLINDKGEIIIWK